MIVTEINKVALQCKN